MSGKPRVVLAAESLHPHASGIARVARLMALSMGRLVADGRIEGEALTLRGETDLADLPIPVRSCAGSRLAFVAALQKAAVSASHFVYDFAGMARAHPRLPRRPFLTWIHGIEVWEDARRDRLAALARAANVLSNSSYTRQRAVSQHPSLSRAQPCWLGTEETIPLETFEPSSPPVALILGRVDAGGGYKGHRELIACWSRVRREVPDALLVVAGGGPGESALRRSSVEGVEFRGFVPEDEIEELWGRSCLLVMPSRGEGFGLVYAEAMKHGRPVIASVHDAGAEINRHGDTGLNVDLDDPASLSGALVALLGDRQRRREMGRRAREVWERDFSFAAFEDRFLALFEQFLVGE